jgi:hypothetical protein
MTGRPHLSTTRLTSSDNGLCVGRETGEDEYYTALPSSFGRYSRAICCCVREDCVCAQNLIKECRHAYNW